MDPDPSSGLDGWASLGLWAAGLAFAFVMERLRKWAQSRDDRQRRITEAADRKALFDEWTRLHERDDDG